MPACVRLAVLLCALVLALALPAAAGAQLGGGGGDLGAPAPSDEPVAVEDPTDDGWQPWMTLAATLSGVALLVGIGVAITRDARRNAPVDDTRPHHGALADGDDPRHLHRRQAKQRARQRQKAAKAARRRNRAR